MSATTSTWTVTGMTCGHCVASVTEELQEVAGVTDVAVEGLMAEIRVGIGDQELVAVITRSAAERLRLRPGDAVYAVVKSTEVMIGKG